MGPIGPMSPIGPLGTIGPKGLLSPYVAIFSGMRCFGSVPNVVDLPGTQIFALSNLVTMVPTKKLPCESKDDPIIDSKQGK